MVELTPIRITTPISVLRRSIRSAQAPRKAPNRPMGSSRSIVIMETRKAELVRS